MLSQEYKILECSLNMLYLNHRTIVNNKAMPLIPMRLGIGSRLYMGLFYDEWFFCKIQHCTIIEIITLRVLLSMCNVFYLGGDTFRKNKRLNKDIAIIRYIQALDGSIMYEIVHIEFCCLRRIRLEHPIMMVSAWNLVYFLAFSKYQLIW